MTETVSIPLTRGHVARVDAADLPVVGEIRWSALVGHGGYVYAHGRCRKERKTVQMHRLLMQPPAGLVVDHINGDTLDNRRSNLRLCTRAENSRNVRARTDGASRFKGVWFESGYGRQPPRWRSRIMVDRLSIRLGSFKTEEDAARAYDIAAVKYFGEFALTNAQLGLF